MKLLTFVIWQAVLISSTLFQVSDQSSPSRPLVCELYSSGDGAKVNKTDVVVCELEGNWKCFVLWDTRIENNQTIPVVHRKGCFQISFESAAEQPACSKECIQQPHFDSFKSDNVKGFCCCTQNMCNRNFTMTHYEETDVPTISLLPTTALMKKLSADSILITIVCVLVAVCTAATMLVVQFIFKYKRKMRYTRTANCEKHKTLEEASSVDLDTLCLNQIIGQGRYGVVWKATLDEESRAVKIFPLEHRMYWMSEKDVYLAGISHPNILKFFAAEERQDPHEYLLITEYHSYGSLMNFLQRNVICWQQMRDLGRSLAAGLAFLHESKTGENNKPAFVHRDVNSKNVLVNSEGMCVLADFGFAMQVTSGVKSADDTSFIGEVGTVRYMAPEVLDGAVNLHDCHAALKAIDVYAMALVLWEIVMRCTDMFGKEEVPEYKMPFERELGPLFSVEHLRKYVVTEKLRPVFPDAWKQNHPGVRALKATIDECWDQDGDARLTAMTVWERMTDLAKDGLISVPVEYTIEPFQQNFKTSLSNSTSSSGVSSMTPL